MKEKSQPINQQSDAKASTHHLPQDAQPVSKQQLLWDEYHPKLLLSMMVYGTEHPFGQFRSAVPPVSPPNLKLTPSLHSGEAE